MIVFGEDPAIEVRGHIVSDIHLCHVLVIIHLVLWNADALLQTIPLTSYSLCLAEHSASQQRVINVQAWCHTEPMEEGHLISDKENLEPDFHSIM